MSLKHVILNLNGSQVQISSAVFKTSNSIKYEFIYRIQDNVDGNSNGILKNQLLSPILSSRNFQSMKYKRIFKN